MSREPRSSALPRFQVTDRRLFFDRRQVLKRLGWAGLGWGLLGGCDLGREGASWDASTADGRDLPPSIERRSLTPKDVAASHNNFYEFLPDRGGRVEPLTRDFDVSSWRLTVDGACDRPRVFDLSALRALPTEERLYHFRCVERWAMNVPWLGVSLWQLLEPTRPRPEAAWVVFESAADPEVMPGLKATPHYPWPYREALRIDEARHDLAFLAVGVYGEPLPKQHGAPVRLVVPWKYGYKGAKSIVRITFVEEAPTTFWHQVSPHEYGLLSNVNPNIPHTRWSQENSFWLRDDPTWPTGEDVFPTPIFNGYEAEVGHLYPDEPRTPQTVLPAGALAR